jgi:hypothetical protein
MAIGWGTLAGAIGKLFDLLPIQGKQERWKNELDNIVVERNSLLSHPATDKAAQRVAWIDQRIAYLSQLLRNSTPAN